jgi:hypothetical protein
MTTLNKLGLAILLFVIISIMLTQVNLEENELLLFFLFACLGCGMLGINGNK